MAADDRHEECYRDIERLADKAEENYRQGFIDGMTCFAHWKDGVQYVGTSGTTMGEAIEEVEKHWNFIQPK